MKFSRKYKHNIAPKTEYLSYEAKKQGHGPARGIFFAKDDKNRGLERLYRCLTPGETPYIIFNVYTVSLKAIVGEDTVYTIYIYI